MQHEDFSKGLEFHTAAGKWRCTDIGTRVIVAIRIGQVTACKHDHQNQTNTEIVTDDESWFDGPQYAVTEHVFDEFDLGGCSLDPEALPEIRTVTAHKPNESNV